MSDQTPPRAAGAAVPLSNKEQARKYKLLDEHGHAHAQGAHLPHKKARELHDLVARDPARASLLLEGRIPMTTAEHDAIDKLVDRHGGDNVTSLTRRDPGETGPLLVTVGEDTYEVTADGKTHKRRRAA